MFYGCYVKISILFVEKMLFSLQCIHYLSPHFFIRLLYPLIPSSYFPCYVFDRHRDNSTKLKNLNSSKSTLSQARIILSKLHDCGMFYLCSCA